LSLAGQEPPRPSRGIAFTNWLVSRASRALERGTSRRGFLIGSAMVGSAVAVAGVDYATRPGTAYAAIVPGECAGGMCTDGYTEFCCAINNGINACPVNTFAGGWWRADSSSFCGGGTRYYIDCMQDCCGPLKNYCKDGYCFCEGCTQCVCPGGCGTRRVFCNYFRYGQCHTEIPVSGPIACRVVSCTPPYAVAGNACLTTPAVDNSTAEHAANCATNVDPEVVSAPPISPRRKARKVIQVMLFGTLNCFLVDDGGTLLQKIYAPGASGSDANGWVTYPLTPAGHCSAGTDVEAQDGFQNNFHLFAKAADGQRVIHVTYVRSQSRWVEQTH
jgi:hypothetical protein